MGHRGVVVAMRIAVSAIRVRFPSRRVTKSWQWGLLMMLPSGNGTTGSLWVNHPTKTIHLHHFVIYDRMWVSLTRIFPYKYRIEVSYGSKKTNPYSDIFFCSIRNVMLAWDFGKYNIRKIGNFRSIFRVIVSLSKELFGES